MPGCRPRAALGWAAAAALLALCPHRSPAADPPTARLTRYDSKYYTVYTDVDLQTAREAILRMTRMADEYRERTRGFAGQLRGRFPFYLYKSRDDYLAGGGMPGTAGVFDPNGAGKLMAVAGERITPYTWHTVQHEGFHQFAHAVIGGDLPAWLNEGLAEYFGEGLYTGDGFVTGIVPPWRLQRLKRELQEERLKPIRALMATTQGEWNAEMNIQNYDQAWSMVHFLVHADDGRYAPAFSQCIRLMSQGRSFDAAWRDTIGPTDGFQEKWKAYWLAQPVSPTHELYVRATVATLTSFLARATAQRQAFADLKAFATAADGNALKESADDWLPPSLLSGAMKESHINDAGDGEAPRGDATGEPTGDNALPAPPKWELKVPARGPPTLTAIEPDGTRMTGWFTLNGSHVAAVNVDIDDTAKALANAKTLRDDGKKDQARALVQAALRSHPKSPAAVEAQAFLRSLRSADGTSR